MNDWPTNTHDWVQLGVIVMSCISIGISLAVLYMGRRR